MAKSDFLEKILVYKKKLNEGKRDYYDQIKGSIDKSKYSRYRLFRKQISKTGKINLIAEIKKASPSKGIIRENFDILEIAKTYFDHKAAAISVLTEDKYFLGKPAFVKKVSDEIRLPVLMKDFFVDEGQIYEACVNGERHIVDSRGSYRRAD